MEAIAVALGRDASVGELAALRRLLHESYSMTAAELKQSVERQEDQGVKRLAQPERADHHLFETMCPTAFLPPTLTAKTLVLSAFNHKMHFFWPNLRCKVIKQMVKSRYLVEFPA